VDSTEVGVLEETNHVSLRGFLESKDGRGLESQVGLEIVGNLSNESLERKFSNEELSRFLELSDLSKGDGTWSESVWSLDSTGLWGLTLRLLVSNVLSWGLSSSVLSSGMLGSCHFKVYYSN